MSQAGLFFHKLFTSYALIRTSTEQNTVSIEKDYNHILKFYSRGQLAFMYKFRKM